MPDPTALALPPREASPRGALRPRAASDRAGRPFFVGCGPFPEEHRCASCRMPACHGVMYNDMCDDMDFWCDACAADVLTAPEPNDSKMCPSESAANAGPGVILAPPPLPKKRGPECITPPTARPTEPPPAASAAAPGPKTPHSIPARCAGCAQYVPVQWAIQDGDQCLCFCHDCVASNRVAAAPLQGLCVICRKDADPEHTFLIRPTAAAGPVFGRLTCSAHCCSVVARLTEESGRRARVYCSACSKDITMNRIRCAKCKAVSYCSRLCQSEDWSRHRCICRPCPPSGSPRSLAATGSWARLVAPGP